MTSDQPIKPRSLGDTLDQLLEQAENQDAPSFRAMAKVADLDPSRDFIGVSLRDMDFRDEDLRGFNFSRADLTGTDFRRANVEGVAFHGAELKGAIGLPDLAQTIPRVSANLISGLLETLATEPFSGNADLPVIADQLHMEADDLFPISHALQMLHLVVMEGGDIKLTDTGKQFVEGTTSDRKEIFRRALLSYVPLASHILHVLQEMANHVAPKSLFLNELESHMGTDDAEETLRSVVAWARYAEAFVYDDEAETLSLENPT